MEQRRLTIIVVVGLISAERVRRGSVRGKGIIVLHPRVLSVLLWVALVVATLLLVIVGSSTNGQRSGRRLGHGRVASSCTSIVLLIVAMVDRLSPLLLLVVGLMLRGVRERPLLSPTVPLAGVVIVAHAAAQIALSSLVRCSRRRRAAATRLRSRRRCLSIGGCCLLLVVVRLVYRIRRGRIIVSHRFSALELVGRAERWLSEEIKGLSVQDARWTPGADGGGDGRGREGCTELGWSGKDLRRIPSSGRAAFCRSTHSKDVKLQTPADELV